MVALTVMEGRYQSIGDGDYHDDDDVEEEEEEGNMMMLFNLARRRWWEWDLYLLTIHGEGRGLLKNYDEY